MEKERESGTPSCVTNFSYTLPRSSVKEMVRLIRSKIMALLWTTLTEICPSAIVDVSLDVTELVVKTDDIGDELDVELTAALDDELGVELMVELRDLVLNTEALKDIGEGILATGVSGRLSRAAEAGRPKASTRHDESENNAGMNEYVATYH